MPLRRFVFGRYRTRTRTTPPVWLALVLVLLPAWAMPAAAAVDKTSIRMQPMRVTLMRDARPGCFPNCAEWIAAEGRIVPGTSARFDRVLRSIGARKLPVFIDSPGGSVDDAMAIGREIRARHLDVAVTRSEPALCSPQDRACRKAGRDGSQPGLPLGPRSSCASACVLVLAAGQKRDVAPWAFVGVHQIIQQQTLTRSERLFRIFYRQVNGIRVEVGRTLIDVRPVSTTHLLVKPSQSEYDKVAAYLSAMDIGPALMPLMRATPPSGIHWLTTDELQGTRMVTDRIDGEYVLAEAHRPARYPWSPIEKHSLPERAYLLITGKETTGKPKPIPGSVVWFIDRPRFNPAALDRTVLRAEVDIPDAKLKLSLQMTKAAPDDTTASHRIVLRFSPGPGGTLQNVDRMAMPLLSDLNPPLPFRLSGSLVDSSSNSFQVKLSSNEAKRALNESMFEAKPWFNIQMMVAGTWGTSLGFEHAASGQLLVREAFRNWQNASPKPLAPPSPKS